MLRLTKAKSRLVAENIPLMHWWISNILPRHPHLHTYLSENDIESTAYYGLIKTAYYFDPKKGFKFSALFSKIIYTTLINFQREESRYTERFKSIKNSLLDEMNSYEDTSVEDAEAYTNRCNRVQECLEKIPDNRLRTVLKERFWGKRKLGEVGKDMGICKERVRQLEAQALQQFKEIYCGPNAAVAC